MRLCSRAVGSPWMARDGALFCSETGFVLRRGAPPPRGRPPRGIQGDGVPPSPCTPSCLCRMSDLLALLLTRYIASCAVFFPGEVAQLVRAPDCRSGGRGFEPRPSRHFSRKRTPKPGEVAQLVRAPDCRSGGRGFEPRPSRHFKCEFTLLSCCCSRADVSPRGFSCRVPTHAKRHSAYTIKERDRGLLGSPDPVTCGHIRLAIFDAADLGVEFDAGFLAEGGLKAFAQG